MTYLFWTKCRIRISKYITRQVRYMYIVSDQNFMERRKHIAHNSPIWSSLNSILIQNGRRPMWVWEVLYQLSTGWLIMIRNHWNIEGEGEDTATFYVQSWFATLVHIMVDISFLLKNKDHRSIDWSENCRLMYAVCLLV